MACETPVICSNTSCLPEIVGDAALTFDPVDVDAITAAMIRVLNDHELSNALIERGLERCKQFTWERSARRVFDVIERAI
jgi:alpha-1,3-rhamnosyl/mannosyltransferase